jgi:DNA invertase Pin-like site-specific DNA recombinase
MEYGYCRISTKKQSMDRQIRNILKEYPDAKIVQEIFSGTTYQGRKELDALLKKVHPHDTVIFDSVSRMSRNAEEGFVLYEELYNKEIHLVFLKEPHINTDTYKKAMANNVQLTGTDVDYILDGVNKYLMCLAKEQIRLAFKQAQKEVDDLRQRTREGIQTARLKGKQIGQKPGVTFETKKSIEAKKEILRKSKAFGGTYSDQDLMKVIGIARNSYYKYKSELKEEQSLN